MPGNGKVFVSYAPEDATAITPLFAALDPFRQIPLAIQRDIASPRIVDGVLYFASYDNYVYAFQL